MTVRPIHHAKVTGSPPIVQCIPSMHRAPSVKTKFKNPIAGGISAVTSQQPRITVHQPLSPRHPLNVSMTIAQQDTRDSYSASVLCFVNAWMEARSLDDRTQTFHAWATRNLCQEVPTAALRTCAASIHDPTIAKALLWSCGLILRDPTLERDVGFSNDHLPEFVTEQLHTKFAYALHHVHANVLTDDSSAFAAINTARFGYLPVGTIDAILTQDPDDYTLLHILNSEELLKPEWPHSATLQHYA